MTNFAPPPVMPDPMRTPNAFPWKLLLGLISVAVVLACAFVIGILLGSQLSDDEPAVLPVAEDIDGLEDSETDEVEDGEPATTDSAQTLNVEWVEVGGQKARGTNYDWNQVVFGGEQLTAEDGIGPKAFSLGLIDGGKYDGRELQMYIAGRPGLGTYYQMFYIIPADGQEHPMVVLDRYAGQTGEAFSRPTRQVTASELLGEDGLARLAQYAQVNNPEDMQPNGVIILDTGTQIAELEEDTEVTDTAGNNYVLYGEWNRVDYPFAISFGASSRKITLEDGTILSQYADGETSAAFADNLFYSVREDGRLVFYDVDLGIGIDQLNGETAGVPNITWNDGAQNSISYSKGEIGGCGTVILSNVVTDLEFIGTLTEAGSYTNSRNGEKVTVYEPATYDADAYRNDFNTWQNLHEGGTLEQFAAAHPVIFVRDDLGRLFQLSSTDVLPAAECGKPVIYLYPEATSDIDVTLLPEGGFSYTEPVYQNGWRVTASPDGTLINRDDGQIYPYLFWEGRGGLYTSPSRFWVVKRANVHTFLVSTLSKLGLNQKETADFLEFWEPRMQSAAYYKIGFHGTQVMDQLAPLELSQTPETVVRILMDYEELSAPVKANPPTLPKTPVREGFTVIEWGGVIR